MLERLLIESLLEEAISTEEVADAIKSHRCVHINYNSTKGQGKNTGERYIVPFALGITKSGNPILRAFQPEGDSTSEVPRWKYFRLDRIENWTPSDETFTKEQIDSYSTYGEPNYNGDKTMSSVYLVATFDNEPEGNTTQGGPIYNVGDKIPEKELMRRSVDLRKGINKSSFTRKANQAFKNGELDKEDEILKQQRDEIDNSQSKTESGPIMQGDTKEYKVGDVIPFKELQRRSVDFRKGMQNDFTRKANQAYRNGELNDIEIDEPEVSDFDASEYENTPFSTLAKQIANKPQKIDLSQFDKYEPTTNKKRW